MKVTPVGKKFGKYAPGEVFEFPDTPARAFIKLKKLAAAPDREVTSHRTVYQTRAMTAYGVGSEGPETFIPSRTAEVDSSGIEWDATLHTSTKLKNSDGTWRKKPGRAAG